MPAAVLAGGSSERMGRSKAALPYGASTLLAHQTKRLSEHFEEVLVVAKAIPEFDTGPARVVLDEEAQRAAIYGLLTALEQTPDRIFVLAVDIPALADSVIDEIARRGMRTQAAALVPRSGEGLEPLAAVWRRATLPLARERVSRGDLSLQELAEEVGAEILEEADWRRLDPSGNSFLNVNTLEEFAAMRERA